MYQYGICYKYYWSIVYRHDGCLLPWSRVIQSIPVIWTRNRDEEVYVFEYTGAALPVQSAGFWTRLWTSLSRRSIFSVARDEYAVYALRIGGKYLPETGLNLDNLYTDVRLILWGSDFVLRSDFAPLTPLIVEVSKTKKRSCCPRIMFSWYNVPRRSICSIADRTLLPCLYPIFIYTMCNVYTECSVFNFASYFILIFLFMICDAMKLLTCKK